MTTQPTALRLADALEAPSIVAGAMRHEVIAELRRLHAENEALLKAMRLIQHATAPTHNDDDAYHEAAHDISSAAIDAARSKT
jgi:hypothetical protein